MSGTYTCGPFAAGPTSGAVDLTFRQPVAGGGEAVGYGNLEPTQCNGAPRGYTATVDGVGTPFTPGAATVGLSGYVEGAEGFQHVFVPDAPVTLGIAEHFAVTFTGARLVAGRRAVVVSGTYTCGPYPGGTPDRGVVDLAVRQVRGGAEVTGSGFLEPTVCDGTPQPWSQRLTALSGRFARGAATAGASGYVEGPGGGQSVYVEAAPVTITG